MPSPFLALQNRVNLGRTMYASPSHLQNDLGQVSWKRKLNSRSLTYTKKRKRSGRKLKTKPALTSFSASLLFDFPPLRNPPPISPNLELHFTFRIDERLGREGETGIGIGASISDNYWNRLLELGDDFLYPIKMAARGWGNRIFFSNFERRIFEFLPSLFNVGFFWLDWFSFFSFFAFHPPKFQCRPENNAGNLFYSLGARFFFP